MPNMDLVALFGCAPTEVRMRAVVRGLDLDDYRELVGTMLARLGEVVERLIRAGGSLLHSDDGDEDEVRFTLTLPPSVLVLDLHGVPQVELELVLLDGQCLDVDTWGTGRRHNRFVPWVMPQEDDTLHTWERRVGSLALRGWEEDWLRLLDDYVRRMEHAEALAQACAWVGTLPVRDVVRDHLSQAPAAVRRLAYPHRAEEVGQALALLRADLAKVDAARWRRHRLIEDYAWKFRLATTPAEVKAEIAACQAQLAGRSWDVKGRVRAYVRGNLLKVHLGAGDSYVAVSRMDDDPARGSYVSYIGGRSLDEDRARAGQLAEALAQHFPGLRVLNAVERSGSFHEAFYSYTLDMPVQAVQGVDPAAPFDQTVRQVLGYLATLL